MMASIHSNTRGYIPAVTYHSYAVILTVSCDGTLLFSSGLVELLGPESACDFKAATVDYRVPNLWPISLNIDISCFCDSIIAVS